MARGRDPSRGSRQPLDSREARSGLRWSALPRFVERATLDPGERRRTARDQLLGTLPVLLVVDVEAFEALREERREHLET